MNQSYFDAAMRVVEKNRKKNPVYWNAYELGVRRRYLGERAVTDDEHWAYLQPGEPDRVLGYQDGYYGPLDWADTPSAVKYLRLWRDWNVQDLAERVGKSPRTIEGWEQGRAVPARMIRLMEAIRTTT